jgi:hypothetical protein
MKLKALAISFAISLSASVCFGQAAGMGSISGSVVDPSGAIIAGAKVTVTNPQRGINRALETTSAGLFSAPALVPSGGYEVKVTAPGFADFVQKDIEVAVGQQVDLLVKMALANTTTAVEVVSAVPLVDNTKTEVSEVVGRRQIDELPINGRRVDSFVLLTPGVTNDGTFGNLSFRGQNAGNAFLVDGNDTTNGFFVENAGRSRIPTQISQDAVQEFQVLNSGYTAEFGRASGGVVNTVTRSGSNELHGTAYWFFRNQDFNARDRFAAINPPEKRNQFGGSIGGPIKKDKLFYFFNTEIVRRDNPVSSSIVAPGVIDGAGNFIGCGAPATAAQCEAANQVLARFRDNPIVARQANSELFFLKIDWRPTDRNSFSFSGNSLRFISPSGIQSAAALNNGGALGNNGDATVRARYGRFSWTAIPTNSTVNEFRFGWFKDRQADDFSSAIATPSFGPIVLQVGAASNLGSAGFLPRINPSENRFQFADNFSYTRGKHSYKFGFDTTRTQDYVDSLGNRFGSYRYANVTNFALDLTGNTTGARRWQTFQQGLGNPVVDFTISDYQFYVQDQWRVSRNLTLNYGVRYEFYNLPQPSVSNPDYPATARIPEFGRNWAPRFGFAYSAFNNKTVFRGGYGIFYGRLSGGLISTLLLQNGRTQGSIQMLPGEAGAPVFPNALPAGFAIPSGVIDLTMAADDLRNPYTQQGTFAVEQQLAKNTSLTVSYIWTRGLHTPTIRDNNIGALGAPVTYQIRDTAGQTVGTYTTPTYRLANRVDPRYRRINVVDNGGQSWYNAMAVQFRHRFSAWMQVNANYTWGHAINTLGSEGTSGSSNSVFFSGGPRTVFNGDYAFEKGSGAMDQRHRFITNFIATPKLTDRSTWFEKYVVDNWQLSGIVTLASAQPDTATIFVSNNFAGSAFPTTLNGFGGSFRVPFWPLSSLDIDQVYRADLRVSKIVPLGERRSVYLNFEVFNATNTQSNSGVFNQAYTASNLILTPTAGLGNGRFSGGFPDGTNARRAQFSARFVF